jgi:hypothetical protein
MKNDPDFHFPGASGQYSVGAGTSLVRTPEMAVFRNGIPVKLVLNQENDQGQKED